MSATFKIAKKKFTQNDLRRFMNEHKQKAKLPTNQIKIESPIAKYNDLGELTCVLCKSIVRSALVWKVHINSKQHKENITAAKQLKDQIEASKLFFKRPEPDGNASQGSIENKRVKHDVANDNSIHKNQPISSDFFDTIKNGSNYFKTTLEKTSIKTNLVNIRREKDLENDETQNELMEAKEGALPEGFFDDPLKDAKIRNQDYKDPHDEEWEKFQREIKEETTLSSAIISYEQDVATAERQIEEIDEQIRKWSRVLDLEMRKEVVATKFKTRSAARLKMNESESESNDEDDAEVDEFFDWRAKGFDRKV